MSGWHRDNPELVGTDADPWMIHDSYRRHVPMPESERDRLRDERESFGEWCEINRGVHRHPPETDDTGEDGDR